MTEPAIYVQGRGEYYLADVPALPGCVASGKTRDAAIANARRAFRAYRELLDAQGVSVEHWKDLDPDAFPVRDMPETGLVPGDETPLEEHEIRDFLHLYEAQRAALIALVERMPQEEMERRPDPATWSVRQALEHIMTGTVLILSKLERWPDDGFASLQATHRIAFQRFTVMEPADTRGTKIVLGRAQTARRVMRRLLEHEHEHYRHIQEIIAALEGSPRA
ncbi:MAG TPA: type II toxin-antitoxin system HicB family antitoxin [Candidatus Limnocylindria bacterium]|nr:type II toxin-antitoxin system HicB family antitoxin [Candidatus Limnocylindria bacterium]